MFVFVCIIIFEIELFVVFISTLHSSLSILEARLQCTLRVWTSPHIFDINLITEPVVICSSDDISFHILSLIGVSCGHIVRNARDEQPIFHKKPYVRKHILFLVYIYV